MLFTIDKQLRWPKEQTLSAACGTLSRKSEDHGPLELSTRLLTDLVHAYEALQESACYPVSDRNASGASLHAFLLEARLSADKEVRSTSYEWETRAKVHAERQERLEVDKI